MSYVAFAASLVGAGAALAVVAGRTGAARIARIALTIALVAMAGFIVRGLFLDGLNHVDVGWALVVGPAAAITARQLLPQRA